MARPLKEEEEKRKHKATVYLNDEEQAKLSQKAAPRDASRVLRERFLKSVEEEEKSRVRILGYIYGGSAQSVVPVHDGLTVEPPFTLGEECYGLIVVGDSMEQEHGISIPDGAYAFFCPNNYPSEGAIVHAEWTQSDGECVCTVKRYCPCNNGTVNLEPLNKKHKTQNKKLGDFEIKGVFVRKWTGENP